MRLSKRQLKRIIREEYSRLKRRGLIKEQFTDFTKMGPPYNTDLFADWCDATDSLYDDDPSWTTNTLGYLWEEDIEKMTADEDGYGDDSNQHIEEKFHSDDAYEVCGYLVKLSMDNGKSAKNVEFLINKFLKFASEEMGWSHPSDF